MKPREQAEKIVALHYTRCLADEVRPALTDAIADAISDEREKVKCLREALEKYGIHSMECLDCRPGTPCICGLSTAIKESQE